MGLLTAPRRSVPAHCFATISISASSFMRTREPLELDRINNDTTRLQSELWESVQTPAELRQTNITALVAAGMNDVINMQGWVQAVWWNRIPASAWLLMLAIGVCSNGLFGYSTLEPETRMKRLADSPADRLGSPFSSSPISRVHATV